MSEINNIQKRIVSLLASGYKINDIYKYIKMSKIYVYQSLTEARNIIGADSNAQMCCILLNIGEIVRVGRGEYVTKEEFKGTVTYSERPMKRKDVISSY